MTEHQSLGEVCRRVPRAVICLLSALRFHDIGTQLPFEVWIALPEATPTPAIDYPPLRISRLRGEAYAEGIDIFVEYGSPIAFCSKAPCCSRSGTTNLTAPRATPICWASAQTMPIASL